MRLSLRLGLKLAAAEDGLSLLIAVCVLFVSSLLVAGTLVATLGDIHQTQKNTEQKSAYYAALAGVEAYQYHLNTEPNYWNTCKGIEGHVEGNAGQSYTVKLLPASGKAKCEAGVTNSVIQPTTAADGNTFRVESTGEVKFAGKAGETRSIVATFGNPSFLDYIYVSNYEVQDPVAYEEAKRPKNCEHYYAERKAHEWTKECQPIEFVTKDKVLGPMHTNDAVEICGEPTFGREGKSDPVEMNGGNYVASGCQDKPKMNGTYSTDGPTLLPPSSDSQLAALAGDKFAGKTTIKLISTTTPNEIEVTNASVNGGVAKKMPFPANGVIYVENSSAGCGYTYSPANTIYNTDSGCGNAYVEGSYKESLTIAAANDLIIRGNITTTTKENGLTNQPIGTATLGLIASNFVRIYHPVEVSEATHENTSEHCTGYKNAAGSLENLTVDAAILTTAHSFIVDNYRCGASLGTLTVWGSIAQNWRGPVGTAGGTGYTKNYNYDERLATEQPPDFLTPSATVWRVERETVG